MKVTYIALEKILPCRSEIIIDFFYVSVLLRKFAKSAQGDCGDCKDYVDSYNCFYFFSISLSVSLFN